MDDIRYKDANWLKSQRHWPPRCLLPTITAVQMQLKVADVPGVLAHQSVLIWQLLVSCLHSAGQGSRILPASPWRAWRANVCIAHMCRLLKDLEAFKAIRAV